jgi:transposase
MLQKGLSIAEVAEEVGASISSVFRWQKAFHKSGSKGLEGVPATGRPPKLSLRQKRKLNGLLMRGPVAFGYTTDLWTTRRVAEVIDREFRTDYHPNHVWRVLKGLGWSCQKPERRARERDEAAIEHWKINPLAGLNKNSGSWGPSGIP